MPIAPPWLTARQLGCAETWPTGVGRTPENDRRDERKPALCGPSEQTFAATFKAATVLEAQFEKHPDHPGVAHYLSHSCDYPPIAAKGLAAAKRYAAIAPSAPHALHMPSHIFTRVGAWSDSADSNLHSANVAKAEKEFNNQLHAMDYMVHAFLKMGRDSDALRLIEEAPGVRGDEQILSTPYASLRFRTGRMTSVGPVAATEQPQPTVG